MTEQEFFEELAEIHKECRFYITYYGQIRQKYSMCCPIVAIYNKKNKKDGYNSSFAAYGREIGLDIDLINKIVLAADEKFTLGDLGEMRNKLEDLLKN